MTPNMIFRSWSPPRSCHTSAETTDATWKTWTDPKQQNPQNVSPHICSNNKCFPHDRYKLSRWFHWNSNIDFKVGISNYSTVALISLMKPSSTKSAVHIWKIYCQYMTDTWLRYCWYLTDTLLIYQISIDEKMTVWGMMVRSVCNSLCYCLGSYIYMTDVWMIYDWWLTYDRYIADIWLIYDWCWCWCCDPKQ